MTTKLLDGKAIVITGGGQGLGASYARLAAAEGANVVVNDVDADVAAKTVATIVEAGGTAAAFAADVSDSDAAARLIDFCIAQYGAIDGLVNNAGIQLVGPPGAMDPARVRRLMDVNVMGTIFCGTHAIARMSAAGRGSIVNVTSGAHMGLDGYSIYGASKGAISSLTYCWAVDVAGTGVRVNAVSPHAATSMAHDLIDSRGLTGDERQAKLDTFPTAESNAPVVAYLLSDRSSVLHGQTIRIDGDRLSIISKPSIQSPELVEPEWTVDRVVAAFEGPLAARLMPPGFARVTGEYHFETHKSKA